MLESTDASSELAVQHPCHEDGHLVVYHAFGEFGQFLLFELCLQGLETEFAMIFGCFDIGLHQTLDNYKSPAHRVSPTHHNPKIYINSKQMNIKCITYSRFSTSIPIYTYVAEKGNPSMSADAEKLASKIKALKSKIDEREKLKSSYGVWWVTHDEYDICYGVCTDEAYPERHAFGLIQKLKDKVKQINHAEYETEDNIRNFTKKTADQLALQYNDLTKIDKLAKANQEVKQLEGQIGTGIKKLMTNQESLSQMDDKAQRMKSYANEFHKNSEKLERMLYWRNMKIKILIALCVIGLIGFVVLIIVQTTKKQQQ